MENQEVGCGLLVTLMPAAPLHHLIGSFMGCKERCTYREVRGLSRACRALIRTPQWCAWHTVCVQRLSLTLQKHWPKVLVHCDKANRNRRGWGALGQGRRAFPGSATITGLHLWLWGASEGFADIHHLYNTQRLIKLILQSVLTDMSYLQVKWETRGMERIIKTEVGWGREETLRGGSDGGTEKKVCGCFLRVWQPSSCLLPLTEAWAKAFLGATRKEWPQERRG